MDNKHFIWIVPMLLVIGFVVGYVSGLNMPNRIEFALDDKTINLMERVYNESICEQEPYYNYAYCMLNATSFNKAGVSHIHEVCYNGTIREGKPYTMNDKGDYI